MTQPPGDRPRLTHVDETGAARMVDVSAKAVTAREATAAGRRQFLRGHVEGGEVSQVGGPGSHLVAHLARANCLVVVPEDVTELPAGAPVDVVLIEGALQ